MEREQIKVSPVSKEKTLEAYFQYHKLSSLLFDRKRDEIYNVTDIPPDNEFFKKAKDMAKSLKIKWKSMTHEESNRIMLAMLEDSYNLIREIENSDSITLQIKLIINK